LRRDRAAILSDFAAFFTSITYEVRSIHAALAERLSSDCIAFAQRLRKDCEAIALHLLNVFTAIAHRLRSDFQAIAHRMHSISGYLKELYYYDLAKAK
jgi:predicted trehalose synthase